MCQRYLSLTSLLCLQDILSKDKDKKIKAVAVVHNETTTGVTSDIRGVRAAMDAADHPALLLVDGVSSIGALEFRFDDWGVDVAVTGSQKALSLPTGLGLVCASDKVRGDRDEVMWSVLAAHLLMPTTQPALML